jgi:hypothetical protein
MNSIKSQIYSVHNNERHILIYLYFDETQTRFES